MEPFGLVAHTTTFFLSQQPFSMFGFKILNVITWTKTNPPPNISCRYFTYSTEFIIWARKLAKVPHYYNYELMKAINGDKQMTDVWRLPLLVKLTLFLKKLTN